MPACPDFPQRISLAAAEAVLDAVAEGHRLPPERAALAQTLDRVLTEPVCAPIALQPFDNAAMDGFALRGADLDAGGGARLRLAGEQFAGQAQDLKVEPGRCVRITTGAPLPAGADTVVIRENTVEADGWVEIAPGCRPGANIRRAGEDIAAGQTVFQAGEPVTPARLAVAAALGLTSLPVRRRPRVAVFASGDELRPPGTPLAPGEIYDSNGPLLRALLAGEGLEAHAGPVLPDDPAPMLELLRDAARGQDLLITCGGVSAGDKDHLPALLAAHGRIHFWRVRIKPGMPVLLGEFDGVPVLGLPGNPVAVLACFLTLGRRLLDGLEGRAPRPPRYARLLAPIDKPHARLEFQRGRLHWNEDATLAVEPDAVTGSHRLAAAARNDALIVVPDGPQSLVAGAIVRVLSYGRD